MDTCKTCKHWGAKLEGDSPYDDDSISKPIDPDTYEPMPLPHEVKRCRHPELRFCERPLESNGFAVCDGSEYYAALFTAQDFGCIRHEPTLK